MAEPLVVTAMRQYKLDLLAREARQMREMARHWLQVEQALEPQIMALTMDLAEQKALGLTVSAAKVRQLKRYKALLLQAQEEMLGYAGYAESEIRAGQEIMARLGVEQATQLIDLSLLPRVGVSFNRLPVAAVQYMVGIAGDGKPLGELLKLRMVRSAEGLPLPGVWDNLMTTLVEGTVSGWNPVKTARVMRDGLAGGLQKALVIARTEQLRVYREATRATYDESGIVTGHKRVCAHDMRVCAACLADEGHVYPVDVAIPDHPNGRCTSVPCLRGEKAPTWTAGEDWLKLQNEDVQRSILGGHYEGWKVGDFGLKDLLKRTDHPTWGPGLGVKSLKDLGKGVGSTHSANNSGVGRKAQGVEKIDFEREGDQILGVSADLRSVYVSGSPGAEYARNLPVKVNRYALDHIIRDHPEREEWIGENTLAIKAVIATPEFVERELSYKEGIGHWSQTLIGKVPGTDDGYAAVALSLARLPGDMEADFHQVTTIYPVKKRDILRQGKRGQLQPRDRWIYVGKQKTGD